MKVLTLAVLLLGSVACAETVDMGAALIEAGRNGTIGAVGDLVSIGADVNARDASGRTALHYAAQNGHMGTVELLLKSGADPKVVDREGHDAAHYAVTNGHEGCAKLLGGSAVPANATPATQGLNPALKYPDLARFEQAIGQKACLLKSERVWFFAPKAYEQQAGVVLPYLVKAYEALRRITGIDTEYIIVVYNFPKGHDEAFGGTSNCTLWYDDSNLQLEKQQEWTLHKVPHVSGYIEEMAHNFVSGTKAQFGWEMVGWSIGADAASEVAGNPIHTQSLASTRREQAETFRRYVDAGFVFPKDLPGNLVDRIHAHLLWQCRQKYGAQFWPDFFKQVAKRRGDLLAAVSIGKDDAIRNERYRITVDCFDALPGLRFRQMLADAGISATVDVKSLHPTEPGWNRRLR